MSSPRSSVLFIVLSLEKINIPVAFDEKEKIHSAVLWPHILTGFSVERICFLLFFLGIIRLEALPKCMFWRI